MIEHSNVFQDPYGRWHWKRRSRYGNVVAESDGGFDTESDARANYFLEQGPDAPALIDGPDPLVMTTRADMDSLMPEEVQAHKH